MEKIVYKRFILVKDNFYKDPYKVYQEAMQAAYYQPDHATGYRSKTVYHESGVRQKLQKILGIKITRWDTDPAEENGVFYQGFAKGTRKEVPGIHSDEPYNDITIVIYLTPDLPADCGTSLWMHKRSELRDPAMAADARRLGIKLSTLRQQLERESQLRDKWIETDRIGYRFNRLVAYPSGVFHSATRHFGNNASNGRLYQTFRVGVDWNTLRLDQD